LVSSSADTPVVLHSFTLSAPLEPMMIVSPRSILFDLDQVTPRPPADKKSLDIYKSYWLVAYYLYSQINY